MYIHIYVSLTYFPILLFFYTRKLYGIPHLCNVLFAVRMHLDHVTHDWCTFTQNMGYGETLLNTVMRMRVRSNIRALSCAAVCIILAFSLFQKQHQVVIKRQTLLTISADYEIFPNATQNNA